jgi:TonB family protein
MHKKLLLFSLTFLMFASFTNVASAQGNNIEIARLKQIHKLLDYRFLGGFYGFEKLFFQTVSYPDQARQNCTLGIVIASFKVTCDGHLKDIKIRNSLGKPLDNEVSKFINATRGHWNPCKDNKFTHFEIPIQFTLKGTETDSTAAALVYEGSSADYTCFSDSYYLRKAKQALKKGKGNKAQIYLETLIHRNPYETSYYKMLEQAVQTNGKKDKHKHKK